MSGGDEFDAWLGENLGRHERLTESVVAIVRSLLDDQRIEYLSVDGRTKTEEGIREKIKRKNYREPIRQLTDISGIRVVLFIESDVHKVAEVIRAAFLLDAQNSSDKDLTLDANQVGYRSQHFVCELGDARSQLPEFKSYSGLKFELQVRTVLQHAWAELAHDRAYKFRVELPKEIQRKLFLYAGLLEIADKGFAEIASEIDNYSRAVSEKYKSGNLDVPLNALSLREYFKGWAKSNEVHVANDLELEWPSDLTDLLQELSAFGVSTISQLDELCPRGYGEALKRLHRSQNVFGVSRDWMLISNAQKLLIENGVDWVIEGDDEGLELIQKFSTPENYEVVARHVV